MTESKSKEVKTKKLILAVIFIAALVAIGFLIWRGAKPVDYGQKAKISIPKDLTGIILLSLQPLDNLSHSGIYAFDINRRELKEIYAAKEANSIVSNAAFQPSGKLIAFVEKNKNGVSAVNVFDLENKEVENIFSLTGSAIDWLGWSPDGSKLAYSSYVLKENEVGGAKKPGLEKWEISISDLSGKQKFITTGSCLRFISNEEIVFIKDGAFWLVNLQNGAKKVIFFENQFVKRDTQIAVSEDFSMVTWSTPSQKKFYLAKLNSSAGDFSLSDSKTVNTLVYSPYISPDKNYIIAYRPGGIIAADVNTLKATYILDLTKFLISDKIVSDWVVSLP